MFHFTAQSFARPHGFVKSMGKQTRKSHIGAGVSSAEREVLNDRPAETTRAIAGWFNARRVEVARGVGKSSHSLILGENNNTKQKFDHAAIQAIEITRMRGGEGQRAFHLLVACSRSHSRSGLLAGTGVNSRFWV